MSPFYDRDEERNSGWVWGLAAGALLGVVAAGWLLLSSPEESMLSGRAFDMKGPSPAGSSRSPRAVERRSGTGLDMISVSFGEAPSGVRPEDASPYASADQASGSGPAAASSESSGSAAPAASDAAPAAAKKPPVPDADPKELAAAGLPTSPAGLTKLGAQKGLLSSIIRKMLDHPRVVKALLNNKLVVDAVMSRETSRRNCADVGALKSVLSDPKSAPMTNLFPIVKQALSSPETAAAMVDTEMARRVMDCPSAKAITSDPSAIMSVALANPAALGLVGDPRVAQALAANPQAMGMLSNVQGAAGGMAPKP